MVVEYIRYRIPESRAAAFEAAYTLAQAQLRLSPDCRGFELSRCEEEPEWYMLRIDWESTERHLEGFRKGPLFSAFLAHVRPFIDCVEEMRHYQPTAVRSSTSVYDAAGGAPAFRALAEGMHHALQEDALLGPMFARVAPEHVPHLAKWLGEVFGGPAAYTEELGDLSLILARHANLDITEPQRARFAEIGAEVAATVWPDRPDVVQTVSAYLDWGTGVAVENSRPGHVPDPAAGVPTWGWS